MSATTVSYSLVGLVLVGNFITVMDCLICAHVSICIMQSLRDMFDCDARIALTRHSLSVLQPKSITELSS